MIVPVNEVEFSLTLSCRRVVVSAKWLNSASSNWSALTRGRTIELGNRKPQVDSAHQLVSLTDLQTNLRAKKKLVSVSLDALAPLELHRLQPN